MNTILQVPINKDLRNKATVVSERLGFSSLQETVRVFLTKLSTGEINIGFEEKPVRLSPKAARRYDKMIEEVRSGKVKTKSFDNVEDLMKELNS